MIHVAQLFTCLLLAGYAGAQTQNYARYDHAMAYLGGYLFVAGGRTESKDFTDTSLVLSLGTRVNSNTPDWQVQNGTNVPRGNGMAMVGLSSKYKFQVVLYGGDIPKDTNQYSDHEFSVLGQPDGDWGFISQSEIPARRMGSTLTYAPDREVIFILGGTEQSDTDQMAADPFDHMYFPASENCVPVRMQSEAPSSRFNHGAVMLNSSHLVVVGGMESATQAASLDQVHLLDTLTQTWSQVTTQGSEWFQSLTSSPPVVYKQRLYFFGGRIQNNNQTLDSFLVLDTTTYPWTWSNETLKQDPDQDSLQGRYSHTTFAAGQYMFIAFGKTEQGETDELVVIDLENKKRINEFDPAL
ncbi:Leucine-zipper-like transcriptional regulator 1, partial [Dispira parvispora]